MIKLTGTIEKIETQNNNGSDKKVVTLKLASNDTVFIEFQGSKSSLLDDFIEGHRAQISIKFKGKVSNLERMYNNIIGTHIEKISL